MNIMQVKSVEIMQMLDYLMMCLICHMILHGIHRVCLTLFFHLQFVIQLNELGKEK